MHTTEGQLGAPTRFVGFDVGGEVFLSQGRVLRGIYPGNSALYREVLRTCEVHDLFRFGIVATRELHVNPHPDMPYDLVLEHERIPCVSYPHEWPASMLKATALFHIDLYTELGPYGLTIKDWHPYNILFKATKPDGQPRRMLDTQQTLREFGFKAKTSLEEGLGRTIEWYKDKRLKDISET